MLVIFVYLPTGLESGRRASWFLIKAFTKDFSNVHWWSSLFLQLA